MIVFILTIVREITQRDDAVVMVAGQTGTINNYAMNGGYWL